MNSYFFSSFSSSFSPSLLTTLHFVIHKVRVRDRNCGKHKDGFSEERNIIGKELTINERRKRWKNNCEGKIKERRRRSPCPRNQSSNVLKASPFTPFVTPCTDEFLLVSDASNGKNLGLFCFNKDDAEAFLNQVTAIDPHIRQGSKVVPVALNKEREKSGVPTDDFYVDPYGGPPQQWQHNSHPPSDHVISMMPKPPPPAPVSSRPLPHSPIYPSQQPPPTPFMSSSGGSGSNYSEQKGWKSEVADYSDAAFLLCTDCVCW